MDYLDSRLKTFFLMIQEKCSDESTDDQPEREDDKNDTDESVVREKTFLMVESSGELKNWAGTLMFEISFDDGDGGDARIVLCFVYQMKCERLKT
ncbi:unnamed protein product [Anisakis simplex]|uniref:Uncharacterized protein n=2 Tax=Anisakis simplex TaxID=6269 RepID=A0A0M3J7Y4_ANISI|nr:unnamed protein product [Anisakis simplex]